MIKIKMIISESKRASQMVENFMEGDCLIFAKALASIVPDSTIVSLMVSHGGRPSLAHVLVDHNGTLYDASGPHMEDEIIDQYEAMGAPFVFIEEFKDEHLRDNPNAGSMHGTNFESALSHAKKIKDKYIIRA